MGLDCCGLSHRFIRLKCMGLDCCGLFHRFILAVIVIRELLRAWQLIKRLQWLLGKIVQAQEMFELKFSYMLPSLFSAVGRLCASSVVARLFRLGCRVDNQPVAFVRKPRLPCCVSSSRAVPRLFSRGCRVVSLTVLAADACWSRFKTRAGDLFVVWPVE